MVEPVIMSLEVSAWSRIYGEMWGIYCEHIHAFFFFLRFYLFIFRERGREVERETSTCGCLLHAPYWGPGLQPRHVLWLGIELVTLCFTGLSSVHWAIPARVEYIHAIDVLFGLLSSMNQNDFSVFLQSLAAIFLEVYGFLHVSNICS